jgi:Cu-Zn family superoxide dismutase
MKRAAHITAAVATLVAAACASTPREAPDPVVQGPAAASAQLRDPGGRTVAAASASEVGDGLRVRVEASGLAPGVYGAHLHAVGRCDSPSFESAGPHWNPGNREHGRDNPRGQHLGDLPNLLVGTDGRGSFEFTIPGATISNGPRRLLDADGASVLLHARPDDYRTDPSGNSGARIACGVLD